MARAIWGHESAWLERILITYEACATCDQLASKEMPEARPRVATQCAEVCTPTRCGESLTTRSSPTMLPRIRTGRAAGGDGGSGVQIRARVGKRLHARTFAGPREKLARIRNNTRWPVAIGPDAR